MRWSDASKEMLVGAIAGLGGSLVYAISMTGLDLLPSFTQVIRLDSSVAGFMVILVVGTLVGMGLSVLLWYQRSGVGETLTWAIVYSIFWWYLGPLTLQPLFQGDNLTWDVASAQSAFPIFLGHVVYGSSTGLFLVVLRTKDRLWSQTRTFGAGDLVRGGLAGTMAAGLLGASLSSQDQLVMFAQGMPKDSLLAAWLVTIVIGIVAGVGYAAVYPKISDGAGAGLIRGAVYGFFWWVIAVLTLVPLLTGDGLAWSLEEVRVAFPTFLGYLLFGAAIALFYQWLGGLVSLLFSDMVGRGNEEGVGTQGIRIISRSVVAGLAGGFIFSLIMLQIDFFPNVADLVRSDSEVAGFFVHFGIATAIGTSFGLLFRRQSYDVGSALGWGVSYGFFWSVLGPLTLMPIFLGSTPQWSVEAASTAFPNMIGHLAYGAGLGIAFYLLEARYSPWWITRTELQAQRVQHRKEQLVTSSPALWTQVILVGLTLMVLLGDPELAAAPGYLK